MPTWYSRQSSAEIVTDQTIEASDFNNEYNALVTAFLTAFAGTFGTGHDHTGSAGWGTLINLTGTSGVTGVTGVLASKYGGVWLSTSDPGPTDDSPDHVVGSRWINTSTKQLFVCTLDTANAAQWERLTTKTDSTGPTVNDASTLGYRPGSIFVDTTADQAYVCVDATAGAAIWRTIGESQWLVKTGSYTIVNGDKVLASTTAGSFSLTAPSAATADVVFEIADHDLTFDTNPVHVTGSFVGVTGTFVIDVKGFSAKFVSKSSMFRII
jgi:hypothetical protein